MFDDLPAEIQKGFAPELGKKVVDGNGPWLWELRKIWNKPAPSDIALPTEIYREVIERRKRYADIRSKIVSGEIKEINDFITYNLNIRQFAQDVIESTDDAEFIRHFYKAISSITILDPTCGSGAFLFAAMNILESLYEACILRMKNFIGESGKGKHRFFEEILAQVNAPEHPNLQYFIYKSIILNNLYGVDIMNEAVEITKLRLFLKLVATVDADYGKPNLGLEPLPDVDFNIRAGNTLVGYATEPQLKDAFVGKLDFDNDAEKIKEKCDIVARAFARYKEIQLSSGDDYDGFKKAKDALNARLDKLRDELDKLLYKQHYSNIKYDQWLTSHQPFHWFAEFYEIINGNGGFDVVIGNPPYVGYTRKNKETNKSVSEIYTVINYLTIQSSNIYAFTIERSYSLMGSDSKIGMIIPISAFSNNSMESLQIFIKKAFGSSYISSFHQRPAQLFDGVLQRLNILIADMNISYKKIFTTGINRWYSHTREYLFQNLSLGLCIQSDQTHLIKVGSKTEISIYLKYRKHEQISKYLYSSKNRNSISYRTAGGGYWVTFLNSGFASDSLSNKYAYFQHNKNSRVFSAILNSNLFWWYYSTNFDLFNFKDYMIFGFRLIYPSNSIENELIECSNKMEKNLLDNASYYTIQSKTRGDNETVTYNKQLSKNIMDRIDSLLAQHYGFTHEELDFIINYDIKYRMGKELGNHRGLPLRNGEVEE